VHPRFALFAVATTAVVNSDNSSNKLPTPSIDLPKKSIYAVLNTIGGVAWFSCWHAIMSQDTKWGGGTALNKSEEENVEAFLKKTKVH
jgi:hypothetical protein